MLYMFDAHLIEELFKLQGGLVREKLWDCLNIQPDVIMEEGFPNVSEGNFFWNKVLKSSMKLEEQRE
jgi:hypothetical protein